MAIFAPRYLRASLASSPMSSVPRNVADPEIWAVLCSSPITASIVTDLPDPDSPTTPSTSPAWTTRSFPRTAYTGPSSVGNVT